MAIKIKICGLTSLDDVLTVADLGADYIGFIFYEKSPRCNRPEEVARILSKYNGASVPVAVFVNASEETILETLHQTGIRVVQLHGVESLSLIAPLKRRLYHVIQSVAVKDKNSFEEIRKYTPDRFLLDTWHPLLKGGTGKTFDWDCLKENKEFVKETIVAGGVNTENISKLLEEYSPWGVDISSGVEMAPGKKDPLKLQQLFKKVESYR